MPAKHRDLAEEYVGRGTALRFPRTGLRRSPLDRRNPSSRQELLWRVWAEFEEMRGLTLTLAQARRLFGLREDVCERVLNSLVREGLLRITPDRLFARRRIDT